MVDNIFSNLHISNATWRLGILKHIYIYIIIIIIIIIIIFLNFLNKIKASLWLMIRNESSIYYERRLNISIEH